MIEHGLEYTKDFNIVDPFDDDTNKRIQKKYQCIVSAKTLHWQPEAEMLRLNLKKSSIICVEHYCSKYRSNANIYSTGVIYKYKQNAFTCSDGLHWGFYHQEGGRYLMTEQIEELIEREYLLPHHISPRHRRSLISLATP